MRCELLLRMEEGKKQRLAHESWGQLDAALGCLDHRWGGALGPLLRETSRDDVVLPVRRGHCPREGYTQDNVRADRHHCWQGAFPRARGRNGDNNQPLADTHMEVFRSLFIKEEPATPNNIDVLALAMTIFGGCGERQPIKGFPEVVGERVVCPYEQDYAGEDEYTKFVGKHRAYRYVGCADTSICPLEPRDCMRKIVQICGKDPDTATAVEMDSLDVRLAAGDSLARDWRCAVILFSLRRFDCRVVLTARETDTLRDTARTTYVHVIRDSAH